MKLKNQFEKLIKSKKKPIAIFDLDGTLFDVNFRHLAIFRDFSENPEIQNKFPEQIKLLQKIKHTDFQYSVEGTLNHIGIDRYSEHSAHFIRLVETFWFKHFFTDEYVMKDEPFEKAAECVNFFLNNGVHIAYISGRDIPNMSQGTMYALEKHGFPHSGHNVTVCLKPAYGMDDLLFKKQSIETFKSEGDVIATFDNEPANVQLFCDVFSEAIHIHYDTLYARPLELKGKHLHICKSFIEMGF